MTPLMKWLKKFREELLGTWEEGPEPPARLGEMVTLFANVEPTATRGRWIEFAKAHAEEAYRVGYVRGFEHAERDPKGAFPAVSPEEASDVMNPGWRDSNPVKLEGDPDLNVEAEEPTVAALTEDQVRRLARPPPGDEE